MSEEARYPEHAKLLKVSAQSQICGEFIDWLAVRGFHVESNKRSRPTFRLRPMLAEFFEIDENKLEEEKRAMLATLSQSNGNPE